MAWPKLKASATRCITRCSISATASPGSDRNAGVKTSVMKQNVGVVREIGDGVAKVEGLSDAMYNEMLDFGDGVTGLVLNLEETEVGAIVLGDYTGIKEGQEVRTTGKVLQVPVGMGLLGRVVNTLGQ